MKKPKPKAFICPRYAVNMHNLGNNTEIPKLQICKKGIAFTCECLKQQRPISGSNLVEMKRITFANLTSQKKVVT